MTPLEKLRLAVATAHTIPGAQLRLGTRRGEIIEVGAHDAATIGACAMRRAVLACGCADHPDFADRITQITVGGSLQSTAAGCYSTSSEGRTRRIIPTFLSSTHLSALLDDAEHAGPMVEGIPSDVIHAMIKPDHQLGVSVVVLSSVDPVYEDHLDDVAIEIAGLCYVEELRSASFGGAVGERRTADDRKTS